MAKKQSSGGIFYQAGYNLGASNVTMQHIDYVAALKDIGEKNKKHAEQLKKENPNGIETQFMSNHQRGQSTPYLVDRGNEYKACSLVEEGGRYMDPGPDGVLGTEDDLPIEGKKYSSEDVNNYRNRMDQIQAQIEDHYKHLENTAGGMDSIRSRGISNAATLGEKTNYDFIQNRNYGPNGLNERLNESGQYEYIDYTTGVDASLIEPEMLENYAIKKMGNTNMAYQYVPLSKLNTGSAYSTDLEDLVEANVNKVEGFSKKKLYNQDPEAFERVDKPKMLREMRKFIENNPNGVKNLIFERSGRDDAFGGMLEDIIFKNYYGPEIEKSSADNPNLTLPTFEEWLATDAYDAAVDDLKGKDDNVDTEFFMEQYEAILNNAFKPLMEVNLLSEETEEN